MIDYIERKQVLDLIESAWAWGWSKNELYDEMQEIPAPEVAPVVHGKWIEYQIPKIICCSVCDCGTGSKEKTKYCPNCGAKMDGEPHDNT